MTNPDPTVLRCPNCGSTNEFNICARVTALVRATLEVTDYYNPEWTSSTRCRCCSCDYEGTVKEFEDEAVCLQRSWVVSFAYDEGVGPKIYTTLVRASDRNSAERKARRAFSIELGEDTLHEDVGDTSIVEADWSVNKPPPPPPPVHTLPALDTI